MYKRQGHASSHELTRATVDGTPPRTKSLLTSRDGLETWGPDVQTQAMVMFLVAALLVHQAAALGAPTDTNRLDIDFEAMDRLDAEGKLDVIGGVRKFMNHPCARGVPPRGASWKPRLRLALVPRRVPAGLAADASPDATWDAA